MNPPLDELERRRPVWEALSDLFLDQELDPGWIEQIAGVLLKSGYSDKELDAILWQEVCPALHSNVLCVAGEWVGFDVDALQEEILRRPAGFFRRWNAFVFGGCLVKPAWKAVRGQLEQHHRRSTVD